MGGTEESFSHAWYWDDRYSKTDGENPTHEWLYGFDGLEPFLEKYMFEGHRPDDNPLILHLGSGDSAIPAELYTRGYRSQLCVDFSPRVVELMTERHKNRVGIEWKNMDVRHMDGLADRSVDVAFDKSTLDSMIHGSPWSPPEDVKENTGKYLREVHRTLKDDGVFLAVTFRQPHFMRILLDRDGLWTLEMEVLSSKGSFDYYGWVLRKATPQGDRSRDA